MNTTFYRLLICQIVTLFANAALRFALPLYLLRKTGSAAPYGGITAAALVPMLAGTLYGGILADSCRKQTLLAVLNFITALGLLAAAICFRQIPSTAVVLGALCLSYAAEGVLPARCTGQSAVVCCVARHLRRGTPPYSSPTPLMNCSAPCWAVDRCRQ